MNANLEMMNYIYQNAQMGQDTLSQLLNIVEDSDFIKLLEHQKDQYQSIFNACDEQINKMNAQPKGIGKITEFSTYLMINMKTITDKTTTHIAEMIIQGSVMGIIDITRNLKKYKDADTEILALGKRLLQMEEHNLNECKKFL